MLHLRNKGPRWFNDFRRQYENISDKPETKDFVKAQLPEEEILLAWDILKPGMVERELRDVSHRAQANPDYAKYQKLFEMKMNYYTQNRAKKYLKGLYGLLGYVVTGPNLSTSTLEDEIEKNKAKILIKR